MAGKNPFLIIKNIHDRFEAKGNIDCQKSGLTLSQFRVLAYLYDHSDRQVTQRELELDFKVSHPTITGILKRMEEKEFITTEILKSGIKQKIVRLTDKGTLALNHIREHIAADDEKIISLFTPEELNNLEDYLTRIYDYLSK